MSRVTDITLFQLVHDFLKVYLPTQRNSSSHTIKSYQTSLELLFDFVKQEKKIRLSDIAFEHLNNQTIEMFLDWLEISRGCGVTTRNQRLACIRSFFNYAASMDSAVVIKHIELQKIPKKKTEKAEFIEFMSESAVKTLLQQPDISTRKGVRDQFFMILLYDTAARIQEVLSMRIKDIRLGATPTVTLLGKGSKVRTVPLMEKTAAHFKKYMTLFHPAEDEFSNAPLFYIFRYGEKHTMSDDNARKLMKEYGNTARKICPEVPDNIYPHLWRHSRAMHLYQNGMDLTLISQWLGHVNLETTLIYAHADTELKRKAIEQATPLESPLKSDVIVSRFDVNDDEVLKRLYGLK